MTDKGDVWFVRNVARELRDRVTAVAKARRQTVGELVTELLTAGLDRLESGKEAQNQAVDTSELGERVVWLEQAFRQIQDAGWADGRNVWQQIERLSERMAALEAAGMRSKRSGMPVAIKSADSHQRRPERAERPVAEDGALFVGNGAGRRLTAAGKAEVMRRYAEIGSMKAVGRELGISDRTVAAVIDRVSRVGPDGAVQRELRRAGVQVRSRAMRSLD